ncbi:Uncharacterised protein [Streptococcus pneumoniae]|nr:Uncharacterised protein [Streptococcus pneumoniae]
MTPEEMYLTERLDVQIAHFLKKSVQHRRRYKVLKITEIVAGFPHSCLLCYSYAR